MIRLLIWVGLVTGVISAWSFFFPHAVAVWNTLSWPEHWATVGCISVVTSARSWSREIKTWMDKKES
jgi:hypothetical protein